MANPLENLDAALAAQLPALNITGASIAVFDGTRVHTGCAGVLNVRTGLEVTPDSIFQIGSTTKVMTATLIMRLVSEERLNLDDPVSRYLPELKVEGQAAPADLTVKTLLDFTSGIEADHWEDFGKNPDALANYVDRCASLRFVTKPGQFRSYNTTAYCIAGRVIEKVTGENFNDALSKLLLKPMGAKNFCFYDEEVARFRTAVGHTWNAEAQEIEPEEDLRMPPVLSAAGSSVTLDVEGLLQFGLLHLRKGATPTGAQIIKPEVIAQMRRVDPKQPPAFSQLGFGWAEFDGVVGGSEVTVNVASGATIGHNSLLLVSPDANLALAILANTDMGAHALFQTLGVSMLNELGLELSLAPPVNKDAGTGPEFTPEQLVGEYFNSARIGIESGLDGLLLHSWHERFGDGREARTTAKLQQLEGNEYGVFAPGLDQLSGKVIVLGLEGDGSEVTHLYTMNRLFKRDV